MGLNVNNEDGWHTCVRREKKETMVEGMRETMQLIIFEI